MNKNSSVRKNQQNRRMLVSNCAVCGKKKSRSVKNQEVSGLLCKFGIRPPLSSILFYHPCFALIIFEMISLK